MHAMNSATELALLHLSNNLSTFLFAVGVILYGIAVGHTAPPAWLAIRGVIGALIMLGITTAIYTRFSKALREYRASRATKPGKPLQ